MTRTCLSGTESRRPELEQREWECYSEIPLQVCLCARALRMAAGRVKAALIARFLSLCVM